MDQTVRVTIVSAVLSGDMLGALRVAQDILEREGHYDGYLLLVTALLESGDPALAAQCFAALREILPANADVAYGYGQALQRIDRLEEAITQWKCALDLAPGSVDACRNLAMGLIDRGRDAEAVPYLHRSLELVPEDASSLLQLGNIAYRGGAIDQARAFYRQALQADVHSVDAWTNLGEAERFRCRLAAAERCFHRAISLAPDARQAHFNLAALLLEQGRWREGFAEFQWRSNLSCIPKILADLPLWDNRAPEGEPVALWNDQGLGDAMLFLRYAPRLKARGVRTVLFLPPVLTRLAATAPGVDAVPAIGQPIPQVTYQLPLASLPHLLDEADPVTAWTGPYLFAESPRRCHAASSGPPSRLSVGLVWAAGSGSPDGQLRSIPLATLVPLAALPDIHWVSLQVGTACAEIEGCSWAGLLQDMSSCLTDFADTAAILSGLDLVISVDTSVAHLAGALGKPVWILLPRPCDWKWGRQGDESVWYPTATLFRQDESRAWESVVSAVDIALRAYTNSR